MKKSQPRHPPRPRILTTEQLAVATGGLDFKNNASTSMVVSWADQK